MSRNSFEELLTQYSHQFSHGQFTYELGANLKQVIAEAGVPDEVGVYTFSVESMDNVVYIGKAGSLRSGGWSKQKLKNRLSNKQGGGPRQAYLNKILKQSGDRSLIVRWWVTASPTQTLLPVKAEADLAQAYWETYGRLPLWNRAF